MKLSKKMFFLLIFIAGIVLLIILPSSYKPFVVFMPPVALFGYDIVKRRRERKG
ncbi:hypothetical protein ACFFGV_12975 [Pontibacillus salicampi]|uniref:Uncharacterized protein n=1 Tax=Pontibacillus salicampi TaxID=1449801 RepID=A0ABV6LPY9_9BACI